MSDLKIYNFMRNFLLSMALVVASFVTLQAQTTSNFEDLNLPADTFWNGSDLSGNFISGNAVFSNQYDTNYYTWGGFAYSSKTDTITTGWSNMYSSISGSGNISATYAVAYVSAYTGATSIKLTNSSSGKLVSGFYINNNTYAYYSMKNGDTYAKKFGGTSGNDSDWFMLTVQGYLNGSLTDTVNFFLADYRFADNSKDYIIKDWTMVNLMKLGNVDSLAFVLSSSDNGAYGMNTPSYFCMDDLQCLDGVNVEPTFKNQNNINVYPNPSTNNITISGIEDVESIRIFDTKGSLVYSENIESNLTKLKLDISNYTNGLYFIQIISNNNLQQIRFIKQ